MTTSYTFRILKYLSWIEPAGLWILSLSLMLMAFQITIFPTSTHATEESQQPMIGYVAYITQLPARKLFFVYGKRGCGYINSRGKVVLKPNWGIVDKVIYDGWARLADENLDNFYILDETGKRKIRVPGKWGSMFSDGMMSFENADQDCGFMDKTGKIAITPVFAEVGEFREGLAAARKSGGKFGFVDKKGNFVIEPNFDKVDVFTDGRAAMIHPVSQCTYIDRTGKQAMQASFKHCFRFYDGVAMVMTLEGKWGFIDHSGNFIWESVSPEAADYELFSEGLSNVMVKSRKVGYINTKGEFVILPRFKYALPFYDGLALACDDNDLWGYIDKTGRYVIPPRFCDPNSPEHGFFSEGLAFACDPRTKKYGYIDKSGKWVIRPRFDACEESSGYNCQFSGGLAWVSTDTERQSGGHYHYINRKGKYVWSFPRGAKRSDKGYGQFKELIKPFTK